MFKAIFTNSFGILFSRILGFIRDLLTASVLGANIYSDIFFIAFKLPNLFRRIFAEGAFTQVYIPAFAKSRHKGVFAANIFVVFLSIILIITILVNLLPALATKAIAVGFDSATIELASPFVAINFWYLPLIFGVTFLSTMLQYKHHFATSAFSTALLNISLIFALLLSEDKSQTEIVYYLSWGVVIGGLMQLGVHGGKVFGGNGRRVAHRIQRCGRRYGERARGRLGGAVVTSTDLGGGEGISSGFQGGCARAGARAPPHNAAGVASA